MSGLGREDLAEAVQRKIHRPLFACLVGDHLAGWARPSTPYEIAGAMLVPVRLLLGLRPTADVKERQVEVAGRQVTLRFRDLRPWLHEIAGTACTQALEAVFSPHVVTSGEEHQQLQRVAQQFVTRQCGHDLLERAQASREAFEQSSSPRVRDLLEVARIALMGRTLLSTGEVESSLQRLLERHDELWLRPFLQRQRSQGDEARLDQEEARLTAFDLDRLERQVVQAQERSALPASPGSITELDEFLVRVRLRELESG